MTRWATWLVLASCSSSAPPAPARDAAPAVTAPLPVAIDAAPAAPARPAMTGPRVLRDGKPAAGAEVVLWGPMTELDGEPLARIVVAADGTFALDEVPSGAVWIGAFAPGAMPTVAELPRGVDPAEVFLHLGACEDPYQVVVVDPSGRPIAGARLTDEWRDGLAFAETGRDGRATACYRGAVSVVAKGFATAQPIDGSGTVRLARERTLTGTTEPGAIVEALWYGVVSDDQPLYFSTRADARGRFTLRGLSPGELAVSARRLLSEGEQVTQRIDVEIGGRAARPLKIPIPALELHDIEVLDAAGPLSDTAFDVWTTGKPWYMQWSGVTDHRGRARAPAGNVSVDQRQGGKTIDGDPVRHVLDRMPSLVGRVTRDGVPVAGATVSIQGDGFANGDATDATGRFLAQMFGTGKVHITVDSHELGVAAYHDLDVTNGFNETDFALTAAASVSGVVVDRAGRPVPSVQVRLLDRARSSIDQVTWLKWAVDTTDAAGRFRIAALPGGTPPLGFDVFPLGTYGYEGDLYRLLGTPTTVTLPDDTTAIDGVRLVLDIERVVPP